MNKVMRVLHVNAEDIEGGAARAASRISTALRDIGVDSEMLVLNRRGGSRHVHQAFTKLQRETHRIKLAASAARMRRQRAPGNPESHSLNWFDSGLGDWINRSDFDLVNLHWVGADMLSVEEIGRLKKPVVWTMHDMWPISGAEHYDDLDFPGRFKTSYGPASRPPANTGPDLDARVWQRKASAWKCRPFHLVSPSRWLASCAANSSLMREQDCTVIPNCLDLQRFQIIDRRLARQVFGLRPDRQFILFGAMSAVASKRKGFHLLLPALRKLAEMPGIKGRTELLIFGSEAPSDAPDFGLPAHYLGNLFDEVSLAVLYSAANVFAAPSMLDNLPNTVLESLACGTPCVAFNVGGMPDMVTNGISGQLVPAFDISSLAAALHQMLSASDGLRRSCRTAVEVRHAPKVVAEQYLEVYRGCL